MQALAGTPPTTTRPQGVAGRELRVAVASGIGAAQRLLENMRGGGAQFDFIEVGNWERDRGGCWCWCSLSCRACC